jgi:hypothetical protein
MPLNTSERLSWSLRHRSGGELSDRFFAELLDGCRRICEERFPEAEGFEIASSRLGGPIEGMQFAVTQAGFEGLVSVQRYRRLVGLAGSDERPMEVRVVAAAAPVTALAIRTPPSRGSRVALAGGASLASMVLALGAMGLLSPWMIALSVLLVLIGMRMVWALRIARRLRQQALTDADLTGRQALAAAADDHHRRWTELLGDLERQRETMAGRLSARPFRSIPTALEGPLKSVG